MNILIVAGGTGTRLWPASTKKSPKQLLKLIGDKTLLQNTYERSLTWVSAKNLYIATTSDYAQSVQKQLPAIPRSHYSIEPVLKERAPAIGLAALIMHHNNPRSSFMCMWSDHSIQSKPGYFQKLLIQIEKFLDKNPESTLTIGAKPTFAHTGLGYIQKGTKYKNKFDLPLYNLKSFKEKPNSRLANQFIKSNDYLWNSGYFVWKTATLLALYKHYLPEIYSILMQIRPALGTKNQQRAIDQLYPKMPHIDIERGLLEKIKKNIYTLEAEFMWADIGNWKIVKDIQSKTKDNLFSGLHIDEGSKGTLVYNHNKNQIIATVGLDGMIIINTPSALLVANKENSEQVREIIKKLKADKKFSKYL